MPPRCPPEPFVQHCLELLSPLGPTRARRMFGGHGLYADDIFVALIANEVLYLKVDAASRARFEAAGCRPFVYEGHGEPVTMSYWTVPDEAMESPALMAPWARLAMQAALSGKAAKAPGSARRQVRAPLKPRAGQAGAATTRGAKPARR